MRSRSSRKIGPLALSLLLACSGDLPPDTDSPLDTDADTDTPVRWSGRANVRVIDPDGAPVEGALVMQGGAALAAWVTTDAAGRAAVDVIDDGLTDRWLLVGKVGWISGGEDLRETKPPPDPLEIVMKPLPGVDNGAYAFQLGGDGDSMTTDACGHCHNTIADDFTRSAHRSSARNPRTWDVYTGSATSVAEAECVDFGGWLDAGRVPGGDGGQRCNVGEGVLPFLNPGCGSPGEVSCDVAGTAEAFGACADCHAPAVDGGEPGHLDLATVDGIAFEEGITCDFCHKIRYVAVGGGPGLDGSIFLERPSQPSLISGQAFDPITFGPYPDVIVGIMNGSYAPQMREASWCAGCHEYARVGLDGGPAIDPVALPDGLPLHETFSEWERSGWADLGLACQGCHMAVLDEESSTYDIREKGLAPAPDQGWLRASGEVRHHDWPGAADMTPPTLTVRSERTDEGVSLDVRVINDAAGHAVPTGEPLRQLVVLVDALDSASRPMIPDAGRTVPDVGGYQAKATVGVDLTASGPRSLRFVGQAPRRGTRIRVVRPTGTTSDDAGPGTPWSDAHRGQGLPISAMIAELSVAAIDGDRIDTAEDLPALAPGDVAYLVADGDHAGAPGWLYAKVLVDPAGARGVAHYRAVDVASDNRIAAFAGAGATWTLPPTTTQVTVRLVYRPVAASVARVYGWDLGDLVVASESLNP